MAQIKTPYGLVYNTDGSLCTTYRDDDVPFQGVRSFAVEEATENLFDNFNIVFSNNWNGVNEIIDYPKAYSGKAVKSDMTMVTPESSVRGVGIRLANLVVGKTYTLSFYFDVLEDSYNVANLRLYTTTYGYTTPASTKIEGNRAIVTFVANTEYTDFYVSWFRWISIIFYNIQLEQKSYATSFVDGSKTYGVVDFRNFSVAKDDFVLSYWVNFQGKSATYAHFINIYDDIGLLTNPFTTNFLSATWRTFKEDGTKEFEIFCLNFFTGNVNEWQNIVIIFDENGLRVYVNGVLKVNRTFPRRGNIINRIRFYSDNYSKLSQLISNVFIGKYRKADGSIKWTDDYIREVYEAQIPFPESNKLSIY